MIDHLEMRDQVWQNNKNKRLYIVLNTATHTETGEEFVIYYSDGCIHKGIHARPISLFTEKFVRVGARFVDDIRRQIYREVKDLEIIGSED